MAAHVHRVEWQRVSLSRYQWVFIGVLAAYLALTIAVMVGSPLDSLDQQIAALHLQRRWHGADSFVHHYVIFGQRGPSTLMFLPIFLLVCRARRSMVPLIRLGTALVVLNVSVGVVKIATGRMGPLLTRHAHDVFAGGNIFPSGHVSNAVVLYGVLASVVTERWRKPIIALAVWLAATVGLATLYLDTHWFTDVLGGWLAGALVLMALPWCEPYAVRLYREVTGWIVRQWQAWRAAHVRHGDGAPPPLPVQAPVPADWRTVNRRTRRRVIWHRWDVTELDRDPAERGDALLR